MSFEIKKYQESFIEAQVELGTRIMENWTFAGQTNAENLKRAYSAENFDPDTRLYAFMDEKLVGFVTATIQADEEGKPKTARLEFPITEEPEVSEALLSKILKVLKEKGVKQVMTRASNVWGDTLKLVEKYDYKKDEVLTKVATIDPNSIDISSFDDNPELKKLDHENDGKAFLELIKNYYQIDDDQANAAYQQIKDIEDKVLSHNIVKKDNKIIARLLTYQDPQQSEKGYIGTIISSDESYVKPLIKAAVESARGHAEVKELDIFLNRNSLDQEGLYKDFGILFEKEIGMYRKEL
ncbi:MAG: hypothetical protein INQ03_03620 [Candidatus Heimdallarchaeota archaeon]|nr:hypothetical protein [Candidatus Heimdallarchaeota archaeon]